MKCKYCGQPIKEDLETLEAKSQFESDLEEEMTRIKNDCGIKCPVTLYTTAIASIIGEKDGKNKNY